MLPGNLPTYFRQAITSQSQNLALFINFNVGTYYLELTMSSEKAFKRGLAIGLSFPARPIAEISREVQVSERTVFRWISEYRNGKIMANKCPGRPKKTTPIEAIVCSAG